MSRATPDGSRSQEIRFEALDGTRSLAEILGLVPPPLIDSPFRQIEFVERYVRYGNDGCRSILIEATYVDRDYMEDYGLFYSRSFRSHQNTCQRVHFFRADVDETRLRFTELIDLGREGEEKSFRQACAAFSDEIYLGFLVVKPLEGCPVGRTVLRCPHHAVAGYIRRFESTRRYQAHVLGVELSVTGLAFQQQDMGVSACATTALWSSLQKARDLEQVAAATPGQITTFATQ
jgi:hypothetical protein